MTMRNYTVVKQLGKGSFGTVDLVTRDGERFCVKKVDVRKMSTKERQAAMREAEILGKFGEQARTPLHNPMSQGDR